MTVEEIKQLLHERIKLLGLAHERSKSQRDKLFSPKHASGVIERGVIKLRIHELKAILKAVDGKSFRRRCRWPAREIGHMTVEQIREEIKRRRDEYEAGAKYYGADDERVDELTDLLRRIKNGEQAQEAPRKVQGRLDPEL
ncbi:hypothetical protein ES705_06771 [subsurface metagenome]